MGSFAPAFLYRNRFGIYCFQRRVPKHLRIANPKLPRFVRRSLSTRDRAVAITIARKLSVKFDALAQQFFKDKEGFARAIKLLSEYDRNPLVNPDRSEVEFSTQENSHEEVPVYRREHHRDAA